MSVSALGLGTVKLGRDRGLNYPRSFTVPDERSARSLLSLAREGGINLLDTAPAYGDSEQRLGQLLKGQRQHWLICTKVGESFENGISSFDFSPECTRHSVLRSVQRLASDVLDIVLVHSDGDDLHIMEQLGTLQALQQLKQEGWLRAYGISTKTLAGGLSAAGRCDVVMLTYNLRQREEAVVLDACASLGKGALVKKVLASGYLADNHTGSLQASLALALGHRGTSAAVIGTISETHLRTNIELARELTG